MVTSLCVLSRTFVPGLKVAFNDVLIIFSVAPKMNLNLNFFKKILYYVVGSSESGIVDDDHTEYSK